MKKMKLVALGLSIVMALTLCACTKNEKTSTAEGEVPEILWHDRGAYTQDHELVYEEVNKYLVEKIGAKVKNEPFVGSEFTEKMRLIMASREPFDIAFTSSGSNYDINAANGAYLELDELLDKYGKDVKATLPDYILDAARINGVLYALPSYKDYSQENVFYYRTDLAEKYNLDFSKVEKLEDWEPMLQTIKDNETDVYPMLFLASLSPWDMMEFEKVTGGVIGSIDMNGDPKKIINPFETEAAMEYFKTMHRWYQKGFMRPEIATLTSNDGAQGFMVIQQELPYLVDQRNATDKNGYKWAVTSISKPQMTTGAVRGAMVALGRNSKHPEKAMEFLNILNTDKYLRNLVAYGIEGKHWIAVGEDFYAIPEGFKTLQETGYSSYVYTQGNKYLTRMVEGTPDDIYDKYREFDENAWRSPALGFSFDPMPVKAEYTAVMNAYNEYMPALLTGTADPETTLPKALEKLEASGLSKLLAEMQKQYDEWMKVTGK
ncbi:MAG: ABC transporter substrate-binding protein [Clostridia bacterium]|nr:ABC transporter substrate-binding protein [Clostridia bacterium]